MKHLFVINPAAGKYDHTAELSNRIKAECEARGLDYAIRVSQKPGDCTAITREAAAAGEETRVYACGGDGTLNEVVCGAAGAANLAVTHYPCGSGNDFVKNFREPAAFSDLARLLDAEEAALDLIQVGEDYSLSICSMGIDARIGTEIQTYKRLPLVSGKGAYNLSTIVNLIKGIHRHYVVEIDGQTIDGRFTLICVCNGRFYGGGYEPVPQARPDDGKLEDVFTVIHEMGHSMHSCYTRESQPYIYGSHSIFTAEVASTVNESLLMHHLISKADDIERRKYLINMHIEEFRTTLFRQTMFAEFEKLTHEAVESGTVLTAQWLCDEYRKLNEKYFGPQVASDEEIAYEWARIPHFYSAFYVYKYATGYSAATAISGKIINEGEKARDNYIEFLKTGESDYPIELLKIAGVDMSSPEPVRQAMDTFKNLVDEFTKLV